MKNVSLRTSNGEASIRVEVDQFNSEHSIVMGLVKTFADRMGLVVESVITRAETSKLTTVYLFKYRVKSQGEKNITYQEQMCKVRTKAFNMRELRLSTSEKRLTK